VEAGSVRGRLPSRKRRRRCARPRRRGLIADGLCPSSDLDGPGAAHAPIGGHHFLDHGELDAIGRGETLLMLVTSSSKHSLDSFSKTMHLARRPWRRRWWRHVLSLRGYGPRSGSVGARRVIRLSDLISSSHRIQRRPSINMLTRLFQRNIVVTGFRSRGIWSVLGYGR